ncbi:MFS transporter [Intrasporangium calvum]|uniref:MFS transporter n=1 Tax=Intrasporangium calvum TaxID=53358 RepID=A0ABT5GDZ4_9MICO|nr:MFS transporter [Intrasporangium calvum]MDC5696439.1 MFS transporter [Intrasporangium calvum]
MTTHHDGRQRDHPDVPAGGHPADHRQPARTTALNATRTVGRGIGRVAVASARATAATSRYATGRFHAFTHSGGAGETGLARVTELHASHTAGDAAMMLALAGTLFFDPQTAEVRSQVALFLALTMVPYTLVAPLIGPLLDRFNHGRRWAIGTTMATRAFLCWVLAEAINNDSSWLYPSALGVLVASKAYNISRSAAVPRLLPPGISLVKANSRVSIAGVIGAVIGGGLAAAALTFGPEWALRVGFVLFVIGTVQSIRLPEQVDSPAGEVSVGDTQPVEDGARPRERAQRHTTASGSTPEGAALEIDSAGVMGRFLRKLHAIPWPVRHAMWTTGGTRLLTGFLIMFMAFLAKEHPISGMRGELVLALTVGAIGVGNALGSLLGNQLREHRPERVAMVSVLVATLVCIATAVWYGVWTLVALGLVQGLTAQLAKLCFDALVQREVAENVRASVFAWSETMLQMLWVLGGGLGILLPLNPYVGFPVCAAMLVWTVLMAARQRTIGSGAPRPARRAARRDR